MTAVHGDRRLFRIRRRGRHTTPSQVGKVAERAGKAAPAVAIAGALVAAPQAQHLLAAGKSAPVTGANAAGEQQTAGERQAARPSQGRAGHGAAEHGVAEHGAAESVATRAVIVASDSTARHAARASSSHYTVRSGDTLSQIAEHYYGRAAAWQWLYHENDKTITDPNLIYVGEQILVPAVAPAHYPVTGYQPRHARNFTAARGDSDGGTRGSGAGSGDQGSVLTQSAHGGTGAAFGTLDCAGLEALWDAAGGDPAHAFTAAEIAMAESSGNQYAHSPTDDFGYWQINASNGSLATYDAYGNARSAIIISRDGTDWYPWTTYTSGAYAGRC
jgi:LysM repeat protein